MKKNNKPEHWIYAILCLAVLLFLALPRLAAAAPTNASVTIASGAAYTTSTSVTLSLSATDTVGVTGYYASESSSTPSASASGWTAVTSTTSYSANVSYTLSSGDGNKTVYVWYKDSAGNLSSAASDSITLDTTPPATGTVTINGGGSYAGSTSAVLTISSTDGTSGVSRMCISNTTSCSSWETYSTSKSWTLSSGDGTKTVYVWFKDTAGYPTSSPCSDTITLDTTAPSKGTLTATAYSGQVLLNWSGITDDISGMAGYTLVYSAEGLPNSSCTNGMLIYIGSGTSYTHTGLTNDSAYYYRLCATDNVGNISTGATADAMPLSSATTSWTVQSQVIPRIAVGDGFVVTGYPNVPYSYDGSVWNSSSSKNSLLLGIVSYSTNYFLAVGAFGTIRYGNPDPTRYYGWSTVSSGTNNTLYGAAYSGSQFVAVGNFGTILSTSYVYGGWTTRTSGTTNALYNVIWSGSQFVAVGESGTILTSPDGITWTNQSSGTSNTLYGIKWSGTQFVAVGASGTILTSPDGITWTGRTSGTANTLYDITWSMTQFVAVGDAGTILTSPDGITWTIQTSVTNSSSWYSTPGTWSLANQQITGITWTGSNFEAVAKDRSNFYGIRIQGIYTSTDGVTWTGDVINTLPLNNITGIASYGSQFVAIMRGNAINGNGGTLIFTSTDGNTWASQFNDSSLRYITSSGTGYVAGDFRSGIYTSPDGTNWTSHSTGMSDVWLSGITWSGTQYVAVGDEYNSGSVVGGVILTSTDGISWISQTSGTTNALYGVAWSGSQFVALGSSGTILTSPNGITWTTQTSGTTNALYDVAWSGSAFVVVGSSGAILTSPDGITWTSRASGTTETLYAVTWSGTQFVAVGSGGVILSSPDGSTWTQQISGTENTLKDVIWSNNIFIAVGDNGTILRGTQPPDTNAPDTTITSQPSSLANSSSASFSFTSTETGSTFECQMDTGGYSSCTSPTEYIGLSDGSHTFYVKATDTAGNTDSTPASYTWTIDTTAPTVTINAVTTPTNSTSQTITGTVEAGATVNVATDTTASDGTATVTETTWSYTITGLVSGANNITVTATDSAGNTTTVTSAMTLDTTAPAFSSTSPASNSFINTATVGYALSEDVSSGKITFTRTAGTADSTAHVYNFTASDIMAGTHSINTGFVLVNGAIYTVTFEATDAVGNTGSVSSTNVTYDTSSASITIISPAANSVTNNAKVSYTLSEDISAGDIVFTRTGGTADGMSPYTYAMSASERTAGSHTVDTALSLIDGTVYTVGFENVVDMAGNQTSSISNTNITYDSTAVAITNTTPAANSIITSSIVGYTLSEQASSGNITFTWMGGAADSSSPHVYNFTASDLTLDSHTVSTNLTLVDGAFYTVSFDATDLVGNAATTVSNAMVYYDSVYDPGSAAEGNVDNTGASASRVDGFDLIKLSLAFGSRSGESNWNPACDLDGNGTVDGNDLVILGSHFGEAQ